MNSAQALHSFWSSFGWKAYDATTVPSEAFKPEMPRITYDVAFSGFDDTVMLSASLWTVGYSWDEISRKANEIYEHIGLGGVLIDYDEGKIWIKRGSPFAQRMADEVDTVRRIYLNVEVEYFTAK